MADSISLNQMIEQIRAWQRETDNFRNDSWTQESYQNKLQELYAHLNPIISRMSTYENPNEEKTEEDS